MEKPRSRQFSPEFKLTAVKRLLAGENGVTLSAEVGINRSLLYRWLNHYRQHGESGLARKVGRPAKNPCSALPTQVRTDQQPATEAEAVRLVEQQAERIAELERLMGRQAMDIDFLTRAFKRINESRQHSTHNGETASTGRSTK